MQQQAAEQKLKAAQGPAQHSLFYRSSAPLAQAQGQHQRRQQHSPTGPGTAPVPVPAPARARGLPMPSPFTATGAGPAALASSMGSHYKLGAHAAAGSFPDHAFLGQQSPGVAAR